MLRIVLGILVVFALAACSRSAAKFRIVDQDGKSVAGVLCIWYKTTGSALEHARGQLEGGRFTSDPDGRIDVPNGVRAEDVLKITHPDLLEATCWFHDGTWSYFYFKDELSFTDARRQDGALVIMVPRKKNA